MTNHILVNRYEDTKRFGEAVEVVEMTLDKGKRHGVANLTCIIRPGSRADVINADGTISGIADLMKEFIQSHTVATVTNQVHREEEMKAMYRAGLRVTSGMKTNGTYEYCNLKDSIAILHEERSILMWYRA